MQQQMMWIIGVIGAGAMAGVFYTLRRKNQGFGPRNFRAFAIVLIGTFAALLAAQGGPAIAPGFGILGAIAGYIFGYRPSADETDSSG
jgi:hypothetical protein